MECADVPSIFRLMEVISRHLEYICQGILEVFKQSLSELRIILYGALSEEEKKEVFHCVLGF